MTTTTVSIYCPKLISPQTDICCAPRLLSYYVFLRQVPVAVFSLHLSSSDLTTCHCQATNSHVPRKVHVVTVRPPGRNVAVAEMKHVLLHWVYQQIIIYIDYSSFKKNLTGQCYQMHCTRNTSTI